MLLLLFLLRWLTPRRLIVTVMVLIVAAGCASALVGR